jgi:hypothetical protein
MNIRAIAAFVLAMSSTAAGLAAQTATPRKLELTFEADRRVTLSAQNVTVSEILAEWARRCGCYVVNASRLTGGPILVPVQFTQATQAEVLESLLRQAAGYVLTPSRSGTGVSSYETIYVLATSIASATPSYSSAYGAPVAVPITTQGSPDDELPPVVPARAAEETPTSSTARPGSAGVSVPLTTVTPFGSSPKPPAPAPSTPARGGGTPPPPPR